MDVEYYELPFGVVLLKNFIDVEDQEKLLQDIIKIYDRNGAHNIRDNAAPNPMFSYNIITQDSYWQSIDSKLLDEDKETIDNIMSHGKNISSVVNDIKENDKYKHSLYKYHIPDEPLTEDKLYEETPKVEMNADALYCVSYDDDGKCYRHSDYWNSWVFAVTLGHSCDFRYGIHLEETEKYKIIDLNKIKRYKKAYKDKDIIVRVESGDVVVFNGNLLYHSVTKIYDDLPEYWRDNQKYPYVNRICMQYRDNRTLNNHKTNSKDANLSLANEARNYYKIKN